MVPGAISIYVPPPSPLHKPYGIVRSLLAINLFGKPLIEHVVKAWKRTSDGGIVEFFSDDPLLSSNHEVVARLSTIAKVMPERPSAFVVATEYPVADRRVSIRHVADLFQIVSHLFEETEGSIHPTATIEDGAVLTGKVIVAQGAKILKGAIVKGPVYVGEQAMIANYALVRDGTVLGNDTIVGYCTDVKNSVVGNKTWLGPHMAVPDSIIGEECFFGGGVRLSNMRLDKQQIFIRPAGYPIPSNRDRLGLICGDKVSIGVLSAVMPGRIIGSNELVEPGTIVKGNLGIA